MNKDHILYEDQDAIRGYDCMTVWVPSKSAVDLGRGPGMIPMVGIPQEVVIEIQDETACVAAIVPSKDAMSDLLTTRIWTYFIRRASGQIEHRVTVVDQRGDGTVVDAVSIVNNDCLLSISQWMFEQAIKPKPEVVE
jgi:hypothetical protein